MIRNLNIPEIHHVIIQQCQMELGLPSSITSSWVLECGIKRCLIEIFSQANRHKYFWSRVSPF